MRVTHKRPAVPRPARIKPQPGAAAPKKRKAKARKMAVPASLIPDLDTAALRARLGMTQSQFARAYPGINYRTLQNWEMGDRKSDTAKAYLHLIAASPGGVRKFWEQHPVAVSSGAAGASAQQEKQS